jgi:TonB family protein
LTRGDDRRAVIGLDQVGVAPSATQALGRDGDRARAKEDETRDRLGEDRDETRVVGPKTAAAVAARARREKAPEETQVVGPKTAAAAAVRDRLEKALEEPERVLALDPGDAQTPQVDSQVEVELVRRDMDPRWEPAGSAILNWRPAPGSLEAASPDETLASASDNAPTKGEFALATRWRVRRLFSPARKATTGDDSGSAIAPDDADPGAAPATQVLNGDRDTVSGVEAANERVAEVPEEPEGKTSLEPGEAETLRVASDTVMMEAPLDPRDRENKRKRRKRRAKNKGDREPAATADVSSPPAPGPLETAIPAAAPDESVATMARDESVATIAPDESEAPASNAEVKRLALAANPIAWVIVLTVVAGGAWLLAVLFGAAPPWRATPKPPQPATIRSVPSSALSSEGARRSAETPRPLAMQVSTEAAMPRAQQLGDEPASWTAAKTTARQKTAETARTKLEAPSKARSQVVNPAALARAREDERNTRADQERTEREEIRLIQERRMAEEARRLTEERERTEEARVAEEASRAAAATPAFTPASTPAVTPTATLPPSTAPPEPRVELGQLVNLSDQGVIPPIVKRALKQAYPPRALRQKVEGTVELSVLVDETGRVVDAQVVTAAGGNAGLNEAAVDLVKRSMFHVATKNGVPVKVWVPMKIDYRLPR